MIRFLLFRFLPRRLMPWLMVFELVLLVWRWQKRERAPRPIPQPVRAGSTRRV